MNRQELLDRVSEVIKDQLDLDELVLTEETSASDVDGWDSLAHVRIMIAVEQEFGIRFHTTQITSIANVGELLGLVSEKLEG
jgi:acyl carrier protein